MFVASLQENPIAIALTETWLSDDSPLDLLNISGYQKLISAHRPSRGGGVGLYVRNGISANKIEHVTPFESLTVELGYNNTTSVITVIYWEPSSHKLTFIDQLNDFLLMYSNRNKRHIFCGDLNIDLLCKNNACELLLNSTASFGYSLVSSLEPTRVSHHSSTCIDHAFANFSCLNHCVLPLDISDHYAVNVTLDVGSPKKQPGTKFRSLKMPNNTEYRLKFIFKLKHELSKIQVEAMGPEEAFETFLKSLQTVFNQYFPEKISTRPRKETGWMSPSIKRKSSLKNRLFKEPKLHPDNVDLQRRYRDLCNTIKREVKQAKVTYFNVTAANGNTFFDVMKKMKGSRTHQTLSNTINQSPADNFNNYFANIGKTLAEDIPPSAEKNILPNNPNTMFFTPCDIDEIHKIICSLKNISSAGPDGISNIVLKVIAAEIAPILSNLINKCQGIFPTILKLAKVVPIFKKGDKNNFTNHRPISLLPTIGKVFEKIIFARMMSFANKYSLIHTNQFGFRSKHSVADALLQLTETIRKAKNKGNFPTGVMLDLKNAFDTIDHSILMKKLICYGFRGKTCDLLQSYLSNRRQHLAVGRFRIWRGHNHMRSTSRLNSRTSIVLVVHK